MAPKRRSGPSSVRRLPKSKLRACPSPKIPGQHLSKLNTTHDALLKKAQDGGINLSFVLYDLRHTFATRAAQQGMDVATLAAILGHSGIRLVLRYVHVTAEHQRKAMQNFEQAQRSSEQVHYA